MTDLGVVSTQRSLRNAISREGVPDSLWLLLLTGTFILVYLTIIREVKSFKWHLRTILFVSIPLAIFLFLIADLDNPFGGLVQVSQSSYVHALHLLDSLTGVK